MTDGQKDRLDQLCVNTIRMLAVDMVEKAKSGHPGLPLGAAPMAYVLWSRFLRHNPENPSWCNRDRFILSAGHGSALLYALLHLSGYDVSMEEIKQFRQWGSITPGHPEYGLTPGVECTTGPLGQGFATGVGMAIAEAMMADSFNRPNYNLVDHYTFALVSDGDLMEGVAAEAASLAGTLALGKLIYLYDDNGISIEGSTDLAFTEDVSRRFQAYGWQVIRVAEGNDLESIETAITNAIGNTDQPSLIMVRTKIGYGSPKEDSASAHGEPLGPEATRETKSGCGFDPDRNFEVPEDVRDFFQKIKEKNQSRETKWKGLLAEYKKAFQDEGRRFERQIQGRLPHDWANDIPVFTPDQGPIATRAASGKVLNAVAGSVSNLVGGSADLAPSTKTIITDFPSFGSGQPAARNIHFGVREHAMGSIVNGMALHGGLIPYGATFFVFSDYMRPALRMAALMEIRSIFVFTHDSVGVGEDGPTHQPVEHLASLRAMPNMTIIRPADANETAEAWRVALTHTGPTCLVLSRQKLPIMDKSALAIEEGTSKGAYVISDSEGTPDVILIATGSEVPLAVKAGERLAGEGIKARVVSMPSWELFAAQAREYQDSVLLPEVKARVSVEAGSPMGWRRWVGPTGEVIGIDRFGASAPGPTVMENLGINLDNVIAKAKQAIETNR